MYRSDRPRAWPAAASPGLPARLARVLGRQVAAGEPITAQRRTQRSGPAAVSGAAPLMSRTHSTFVREDAGGGTALAPGHRPGASAVPPPASSLTNSKRTPNQQRTRAAPYQ